MIASADGAASLDGKSGGLGGPAARLLFSVQRGLADVILVGAGTARAEKYGPARADPLLAGLRGQRPPTPPIAVLSARGTVLLGEPEIVAVEPLGSGRREGEAIEDDVLRVLSLAAGAETASTHPFATAILRLPGAVARRFEPHPIAASAAPVWRAGTPGSPG